MSRRLMMGCGLSILLMGEALLARSVFLNGVKIDGVVSQKFEKCDVVIDDNGDVHIEAPGYTILPQSIPAPEQKAMENKPNKRYWLVKEENYPGKTQYDIDIYINSIWFKKIRSNNSDLLVQEITDKLKLGRNEIHFAATKNIGQQRKSYSPQVYMQLIVGEGNIGGNNVMIEHPLLKYKRTADETKNFHDDFTIVAR